MPESLILLALPSRVPLARRATRELVGESPRAGDIELVVSELATNAVLHSSAREDGVFELVIDAVPGRVRVEVADPGPADATLERDAGGHDEYKRGLMIVAGYADKWGHDKAADGRSVRWAEFQWTD